MYLISIYPLISVGNGLSQKWSVLANKEPPKFKHFPVSPNLLRHYAFIGLQLCIALPHFISSQFLYIGISLRLKDISRTPCSFKISWSLNLLYLCVLVHIFNEF